MASTATTGMPSDLLTGLAYACVQIAAAAIEAVGTLDHDTLCDAIAAIDMITVVGPATSTRTVPAMCLTR